VNLPAISIAVVLLAGPAVSAADDLETTFQNLKEAQTKKDAALVKKLALELYPMTSQVVLSPAPQDVEGKEAWISEVAYAKDVALFTEYALYTTAIQSPAATLVDLIATLEQVNPKSRYLDEGYGPYLVALSQTGSAAKVPAIAEKALPNHPENEDLLLVLADHASRQNQTDRALNYANRLTAALNKHSKPESLSAADWERKRSAGLGRGYWIAGVIYAAKSQYLLADKNLRAALPLIKGSDSMLGPALFYLGMANYQLGKMTLDKARVLEAAKFSEQSALITSPYTDQARHNAQVMKNEAATMR